MERTGDGGDSGDGIIDVVLARYSNGRFDVVRDSKGVGDLMSFG